MRGQISEKSKTMPLQSGVKQSQELIETATNHLIAAAHNLDTMHKRIPHNHGLRATALDIRLTLELLHIIKAQTPHSEEAAK